MLIDQRIRQLDQSFAVTATITWRSRGQMDRGATRTALEARYHPTSIKQQLNDAATLRRIGFYGPRGSQPGGRLMPGLAITFKPVA
jgi:hypothetical protein